MRSIEELVQLNHEQQEKRKEQRQFSDSVASHGSNNTAMQHALEAIEENFSDLSNSQQDQFLGAMMGIIDKMNKGIKLTNLEDMPTPETNVHVNLSGIDRVEAKAINIEGLTETVDGLKEAINKIVPALNAMEIRVPEIASPKVTVPKPEITVNIPPIKMPPMPKLTIPRIDVPKAEITVTREEAPRVVEYLPQYNARNQLVSITERYEDGSTCSASGFDQGKVTVRYS